MDTPEIIEEEFSLEISSDINPFIVEAFLLDTDNKLSHSIKYVDGNYIFNSFKLDDSDFSNFKVYESNRMGGIGLKFTQRWKTEADELCCGMNTLVPSEMVFIGFDKE